MTCALRALNLCDGHSVEMPDRALKSCLCETQVVAEQLGLVGMATSLRRRREELSEAVRPLLAGGAAD